MSYSTLCTDSTRARTRNPSGLRGARRHQVRSSAYPPQSLLSEAAAKSIGKLHQFLDRRLSRNFVVMSQSRRAVCSSRSGPSHQRRVGMTTG